MLNGPFLDPKSGTADSLVILLHGYGADGRDLIDIGRIWAEDMPNTVFVSPNAPSPCDAGMGYQWFPIRAADGISEKAFDNTELVEAPAKKLNEFIDAELDKWGLDDSQLVVAGFSQGAMMAMYTMPRRAKPCAGVIGYSGLLLHASGLTAEGIVKMPVLAIHGDTDMVVPPSMLEGVAQGFEAAGFDIEVIMRPNVGHGIDQFSMIRGLEFAKEVFEKSV